MGDRSRGWQVLVVDDEVDVHEVTKLTLRRSKFFGLPVEAITATSGKEALAKLGECDPSRLAVALVDVVMEHNMAGLDLVAQLRAKFGTPLQIVIRTGQPGVIAAEEVTAKYDISNYLAKADATSERLRTVLGLGIRNFRNQSAIRVLCDSLTSFTSLLEAATTAAALDQILATALTQYSTVWQFDYIFVPNTKEDAEPRRFEHPWQIAAYKQLVSLNLTSHRSVSFGKLSSDETMECWGCSVKPLGARFSAAFALRQEEAPSPVLLSELSTLVRAWALTRESVIVKELGAQEQSMRAEMHRERSEAIAQMVAGVAHEVNTPLGVANAAATTMREIFTRPHFKELEAREEFSEDLDDLRLSMNLIERNIKRADALIRSFRQLSVRQLVDEREEVDLMAALDDAVKLYSPKAKRTGLQLNLKDQLDPNLRTWIGYPGQLSQVIMNLISNADRYAYDNGPGVVDVIATSSMVEDVPEFRVVVRDYGAGIPKENLSVIFEAFFTTGRNRGGTGLGLSIVRNIVGSLFGGRVNCESTVGEGTAFQLAFSHCKKREPAPEPASAGDIASQREVLGEYVQLQRRFAQDGGALTAEEQSELAELRDRVDGFLEAHFRSTEKRKHPRIPCDLEVKLAEAGADHETVRMLDISEGGAQVLHARPVEAGREVALQVARDLALTGTVVSVKTPFDDEDARTLGISFAPLGDTELRKLRALIAQAAMEQLAT